MKRSLKDETKTVLKVAKKEYILKFITAGLLRGILLLIPVFVSYAINAVSDGNINKAYILFGITIFAVIFYRLCEYFNHYAHHKLYNRLFGYYNGLALDKTNDNSIFSLSRFSLGQYTNTLISDVDIISGFFTSAVDRLIQIIEFFIILLYFLSLDKYLFLASLVLLVIMLFISIKTCDKVQQLNENRKSKLDKMTALIHEYFLRIREIKSFSVFNRIANRTKQKTDEYLDANAKYNVTFYRNNQMFLLVFEVFRLLALIYCTYLATKGYMEIGILLIVYNYYQKIIDNFNVILTLNVEMRNLKVSLGRFYKILEYSHENNNKPDVDISLINGEIQFDNVLYGYKTNPTLDHVSFYIPANKITAIIGKAGSGKSGVFDLLLKLNQQHEGSITIDGIDINDFSTKDYARLISLTRKQPAFFSMSIKDNFAIVNEDYDDMISVCTELGIHDTIMELENGYDTVIDDNTQINSETKQLLSVARMILKNTKIMLFDETLNELSESSKRRVLDILKVLRETHTIVLITSDSEVIKEADDIIEIENKRVKE